MNRVEVVKAEQGLADLADAIAVLIEQNDLIVICGIVLDDIVNKSLVVIDTGIDNDDFSG